MPDVYPVSQGSTGLLTVAGKSELGNLNLTAEEEAALVAFLKTLTDGFGNKMPDNFVLPPITPLN